MSNPEELLIQKSSNLLEASGHGTNSGLLKSLVLVIGWGY
jgi:hypothetical protein